MQVRCTHCGIPFSFNQEAVHAALDQLKDQDQKHFDARCPNCRKVNRISQERLMRAAPDWGKESSAESN